MQIGFSEAGFAWFFEVSTLSLDVLPGHEGCCRSILRKVLTISFFGPSFKDLFPRTKAFSESVCRKLHAQGGVPKLTILDQLRIPAVVEKRLMTNVLSRWLGNFSSISFYISDRCGLLWKERTSTSGRYGVLDRTKGRAMDRRRGWVCFWTLGIRANKTVNASCDDKSFPLVLRNSFLRSFSCCDGVCRIRTGSRAGNYLLSTRCGALIGTG